MSSSPDVVLIPVKLENGERLYVEVKNTYGAVWDVPEQKLIAGRISGHVKTLVTSFLQGLDGVPTKYVRIEFSIGGEIDDKLLKLFIARSTSPSLFKITVELEPHKSLEGSETVTEVDVASG